MTTYEETQELRNCDENGQPQDFDEDDVPRYDRGKKRYCCCYTTKSCLIIVIVASIVLTVVTAFLIVWFPVVNHLFQQNADDVKIKVESMDVVAINGSGFDTRLTVEVDHHVNYKSRVDPTVLELIYEEEDDDSFGTIGIPQVELNDSVHKFNITDISSRINVIELDDFDDMTKALMLGKSIEIVLKGDLKVHALIFTRDDIEFERSMKLLGFNNFMDPPPKVDSIELTGCETNNLTMVLNTTITNPSSMGLDGIGRLNFSVKYEDELLGYAVSEYPDRGIPRGESKQVFTQRVRKGSWGVMSKVVTALITGQRVEFKISGDHKGATEHFLFRRALSNLEMNLVYSDGLGSVTYGEGCSSITSVVSLLGAQLSDSAPGFTSLVNAAQDAFSNFSSFIN